METSITDWISAIGVLIAIPAGLWSIVNLFRKDKDKAEQIKSLTNIAQQSVNQTEQMKYQVQEMQESNSILLTQLELFEKSYLMNKEQFDISRNDAELEKRKRIQKIKPNFEFYNMKVALTDSQYHLKIINKGETAVLIEGIEDDKNSVKVNIHSSLNYEIKTGIPVDITLTPKAHGLTMSQCYILFSVIYTDIDKNKYKQTISRNVGNSIVVSPPESIE